MADPLSGEERTAGCRHPRRQHLAGDAGACLGDHDEPVQEPTLQNPLAAALERLEERIHLALYESLLRQPPVWPARPLSCGLQALRLIWTVAIFALLALAVACLVTGRVQLAAVAILFALTIAGLAWAVGA